MKRMALLTVVLLTSACPGFLEGGDGVDNGTHDAGTVDAGMDGGSDTMDGGIFPVGYANLSGTVQYHPQELRWRATQSGAKAIPPTLVGATLNIEDAIKAQAGLSPLKTVSLSVAADGRTATFVAEQVYVKTTTLALVASVEKPPPANANDDMLLFSGYELGRPPFQSEMENLQVYVVSKGFLQHLGDVLGQDLSTMLDEGVVLGGASNWSHTDGVADARLVRLYGTGSTARVEEIDDGNLFYFNGDLSGTQAGRVTSSSGLWLRLKAGSPSTYTMLEKDATTYLEAGKKVFNARLHGSRAGTVTSVFFEDLATKP